MNYTEIYQQRQRVFKNCEQNNIFQQGAVHHYSTNPIDFINDWGITYDPRNISKNLPTYLPFILFAKQEELVKFLLHCLEKRECGLIEKTRDMGATWTCVAFSVWLWMFKPGSSVGWGSRKEMLIDKLGDPDSIFEKIRIYIDYLPHWLRPKGFDLQKNASYMKIVNPENGSTITGEAGDNIGRGGRKLIYFKDESAHYEHPEKIEASLSENTDVQIDISSVNGTGNVFYRKRHSGILWQKSKYIPKGKTLVFVMDWRDHPEKDQEWYDLKEKKAVDEGLLHIFRQEVDRDYTSSLDGIVIPQKWVKAAIDSHKKLNIPVEGRIFGGLDVSDGGADKNALTIRKGNLLFYAKSWGKISAGFAAEKTALVLKPHGSAHIFYDCIGVGAGVKAAVNLLQKLPEYGIENLHFIPWNAASNPIYKERRLIRGDKGTPRNKDFFSNLKAQAWWMIRLRFEKTYNAIVHGEEYDPDDIISIDSKLENLHDLTRELSQPTYTVNNSGKIVVDKTPTGTLSPNLADSFVMNYFPIKQKTVMI